MGRMQNYLKSLGLVSTTRHQANPEEEMLRVTFTFEETLIKIIDQV
jgi:hypothetical protein